MLRTICNRNSILTNKSPIQIATKLQMYSNTRQISKSYYTIEANSKPTPNNTKLIKIIYKSLLRASQQFSSNKNYKLYLSLLHRSTTNIDVPNHDFEEDKKDARDLSRSYTKEKPTTAQKDHNEYYKTYIHTIVRELFDNKSNLLRFPSQISDDTITLYEIIQREFRDSRNNDISLAFFILKLLNQKLFIGNDILQLYNYGNQEKDEVKDKCWNVVKDLSTIDTSNKNNGNYYLIAHPLLSGYFARTVILILDHDNDNITTEEEEAVPPYRGTYGLILNRKTNIPLQNAITNLPIKVREAFGNTNYVHDGGPVNVSLQMITSTSSKEKEIHDVGIRPITSFDYTNYYRNGDVIKASKYALKHDDVDVSHFNFFIGASCWVQNQLQEELNKGFWLLINNKSLEEGLLCDIFHDEKDGDEVWNDIYSKLECRDDGLLANAIFDYCRREDEDGGMKSQDGTISFMDCYTPVDEF